MMEEVDELQERMWSSNVVLQAEDSIFSMMRSD